MPPPVRAKYSAKGGRARRLHGAAYSITSENARELAAKRWFDAQPLPAAVRSALEALVAKSTASAVALSCGIARSTLTDALGGARVTRATSDAIQRVLAAPTPEAA